MPPPQLRGESNPNSIHSFLHSALSLSLITAAMPASERSDWAGGLEPGLLQQAAALLGEEDRWEAQEHAGVRTG